LQQDQSILWRTVWHPVTICVAMIFCRSNDVIQPLLRFEQAGDAAGVS
jgi:hypothetical protein